MSLTNIAADNVNDFAESNHMKLDPKKCKEMAIVLRLITIGNTTIKTVKKYKLLGVILTDDLKWTDHVAYIQLIQKRLSFNNLKP